MRNIHITTDKLILRDMEISDADRMFYMDTNPRVLEFLFGVDPPVDIDQTKDIIKMIRQQYKDNGCGRWAV
jgi:ribosomal-protein-alanine N-acetyltransferase